MQEINQFIEGCKSTFKNPINIEVDKPIDETGLWWIDLSADNFTITITWQHGIGFGLFTSDDDAFEKPSEIHRHPDVAIIRLKQLFYAS